MTLVQAAAGQVVLGDDDEREERRAAMIVVVRNNSVRPLRRSVLKLPGSRDMTHTRYSY